MKFYYAWGNMGAPPFLPKRKGIALMALFMCMCLTAIAQTTVSGTVQDDEGNPLEGASILVQGT